MQNSPSLHDLLGVLAKLKEFLEAVDLEELRAGMEKPVEGEVPKNPQKNHIHLINKAGRECYQEYVKERRGNGVAFDKGTPYHAQHRSICAICNTPIEPGHDIMLCRA